MKFNPGIVVFILAVLLTTETTFARYDSNWTWKTLSNKNFTLYYPEGHEIAAARIMNLSDEVYSDVSGYLGVVPDKCPIVLNPGTDLFNGFFSPFPNRISLYETPLANSREMHPGSDLMDTLFTHEYTHFAHITTRSGWNAALTNIFGKGIGISNILSPGWVIEGVTTNTETLFTDGGRGRSALFRGKMLSFMDDDGNLWDLSSAGTGNPFEPPGYGRIYLAGYFMVDYLNRTYGADAFARLSRFQGAHPLGFTSEALKQVTGKTGREFYDGFMQDLKAQAVESKKQAASQNLPSGNRVAAEKYDSYQSYFWTDDNNIVALRTGYDKKNALVIIKPDYGMVVTEYKTGIYNGLYPIRPMDGGTKVVSGGYYPDLFGGSDLARCDLKIYDRKTNKHQRLTKGQHIYSADFSDQRQQFVAVKRDGMWSGLVLISKDGTSTTPLFSRPGCYFESPVWSPDGSTVAAVAQTGKSTDIVLCNPDTGSIKTLFKTDDFEDNDPAFSSDGKWLFFASDRSGIWNIFAWNLQEKQLIQLTSVPYAAYLPILSPDDKTLAFLSLHKGVNQVHTLAFNPSGGRILNVEPGDTLNQPDLARVNPSPVSRGKRIPILEAYTPFIRLPYFSSDEDGTVAGVTLMGADPVGLNSYNLSLFMDEAQTAPAWIFIIPIALLNRIYCSGFTTARKKATALVPGNSGTEKEGLRLVLGSIFSTRRVLQPLSQR